MSNLIVAGADHYNTLWLVRSLGLAGFNPFVVIQSPNNRSFVVKSKYCNSYVILDSDESIIDFLLSYQVNSKVVLFSCSDTLARLFDLNYNLLRGKYIIHNCCDRQGQLAYWMDKDRMLEKAKECGLTIPMSYSINLDKSNDYSKTIFPCLIKPKVSATGSKTLFRICYNLKELESAINEIRSICSKVLIQEYIQSDYEYLIYGLSTGNEICMPGGLTKIHTCSSINNIGMMSYGFLSENIPMQLGSYEAIRKFIDSIGYKGLFSMEFMVTADKAYFLEINLRNDGTCYITTQSGVNLPAIWYKSVLGYDTSHMVRHPIREHTFGMNEVNYFKYTFSLKKIFKCIRELFSVHAFSLLMRNDMKPVMYKFLYALMR